MAHPANVATATAAASGVTLGDLIVQALTRHSSSEAFVAGDRRLTYAQVRDLVSRYMTALARRGVGLGAGVTMLSPNMPESWIVQAATYLLGGRFTGLQALASVEEHIKVCDDAEATDELKRVIGKRLRKKVFFGADSPMRGHERLVNDWREQGYSSEVLDDVFSGNAGSFLTSIGVA